MKNLARLLKLVDYMLTPSARPEFLEHQRRQETDPVNAAAIYDQLLDRTRQSLTLEIAGIQTQNHERNAIALFQHGYDRSPEAGLPIGTTKDPATGEYTVKLYPDRGEAWCTIFFSQETQLAEEVAALAMEGTLNAFSVGYKELSVDRMFEGDSYIGSHLKEIELLEISVVVLPMNPMATRSILDAQICGKSLHPVLKSAYAPFAQPSSRSWSNGITLGVKAMKRKSDREASQREDRDAEEEHGDEITVKAGAKCLIDMHKCYRVVKSIAGDHLELLEHEKLKELVVSQLDTLEALHTQIKDAWQSEGYEDAYGGIDEKSESLESDSPQGAANSDEDSEEEKSLRRRLRRAKQQLTHQLRLIEAREQAGQR